MKIKLVYLTILILISSILTGQTCRISGWTHDQENNPISAATLLIKPDGRQIFSDNSGNYAFVLSPGAKELTVRILGYNSVTVKFWLNTDTTINLNLQLSPFKLKEVRVFSDSSKNIKVTHYGSFIVTPSVLNEIPKLFSEPDLLKSLQLLPGVTPGKEGTSKFSVRGGGTGQNVVMTDGCYFFLPDHLLGIVSPYDIDFLESAELYKDYFPSEIGTGASSILNIEFRKAKVDSLGAQIRFGLLTSGINIDIPIKKTNWHLSAGLKTGNYFIYSPILKKIVSNDIKNLLPDKYKFYDGFFRLTNSSPSLGNFSYTFFGNYDNGKEENEYSGFNGDTITKYLDGMASGWKSMVHALQWEPPQKTALNWKFALNYNRLTVGRKIYSETDTYYNNSQLLASNNMNLSFYPSIDNLGLSAQATRKLNNIIISAGISERYRLFCSNNYAVSSINDTIIKNNIGSNDFINELAIYFSSSFSFPNKIKIDAGIRLTEAIIKNGGFFTIEPRLRISFNQEGFISPHITYDRLSQDDHSVEGSNAGLRSTLWLPLYKEFGPEISDILSVGVQGNINKKLDWSIDAYYKIASNMVDFKSGASFIYDTSFVDMLDKIDGKAYGIESSISKRSGKLTGSLSYTYSRSKRDWYSPEGKIWIPSISDRPHNFNVSLKYYLSRKTSFGLTFIYLSGSPATIYMHETSYGEFFETKNNIRYYNYNRLDLAFRHIIIKKRFSFYLDADIYNVYNRKNTLYIKRMFNESDQKYHFKNISLFPVMPTLTLTIKY